MRCVKVALRLLVFAACLHGVCSTAYAYEDEVGLSVTAGYSFARGQSRSLQGVAVGSTLDIGLADYWSLRTRLDYAFHPGPGLDPNIHTGALATEAIYLIDVVTWVPFFGAGLDVRAWHERGDTDLLPAAHAVLGVDYLWSREFTFGLDARALVTPDPSQGRPVQVLVVAVARYLLDY